MKVKIKGNLRDILAFMVNVKRRKAVFKKASAVPMEPGKINKLSKRLHPEVQQLVIESVKDEGCGVFTYRLRGRERNPAYFIPGQYISIGFRIGGSSLFRAFSISSFPGEALNPGIYDITVKTRETGGFTDAYIRNNWKKGLELQTSGPAGTFTHQRLRDCAHLVCIAGGSGITPFRPLISSLLEKNPEASVLLFHGARKKEQMVFSSYWDELCTGKPERFHYIPVCSEPDSIWSGLSGFITAELIRDEVGKRFGDTGVDACSYFVCGPGGLHDFMNKQFDKLKINRKRIRREEYAVNSIDTDNETPVFYNIRVRQGAEDVLLKADAGETVLVAMERAGLNPPSLCRSGECGWCRSRLVSGKISPPARGEGLRGADKKFGYFHPCSVFPLGDLIVEVPENPIKL